ncbi:MAG: hypothetical protein Unbinned92contig1002_22 [Prokaryotic dsDNA virus sp.]|nr:MAG: hypothetical protein Unbinned92contig1002_22 [Prokaryotic dsDNA virus sp.]|tara:strand:- start:31516 stop:31929 length:414 start_codon:yes stop_codon:yes gene_type:complete
MKEPKDKRTKKYKEWKKKYDESSKGLGDTIEKVTKATGVKKLVKWLAGEDCGCDERKEVLNRLFRYNKPLCLEEDEHKYLSKFFKEHKGLINTKTQGELLKIYNRIFQTKKEKSSCGSCVKSMIGELQKVFKTYGSL